MEGNLMNTVDDTPNRQRSNRQRSKWGRSKWGGGTGALVAASMAIAIPLSLLFGSLFTLLQSEWSPLPFAIATIIVLPSMFVSAWAVLVDRNTLTDAPRDPESSVESRWYEKAASSAFNDLIAIIGLSAGAFALADIPIATSHAFMILAAIAFADVVLRYLIVRRKEG